MIMTRAEFSLNHEFTARKSRKVLQRDWFSANAREVYQNALATTTPYEFDTEPDQEKSGASRKKIMQPVSSRVGPYSDENFHGGLLEGIGPTASELRLRTLVLRAINDICHRAWNVIVP